MQTNIDVKYKNNIHIQDAEDILRSCVHCGFCTATCPTYQLLGDELDSPRGRIYLIKQVLEGNDATEKTQNHLDRCLTCRSCETTCPSGVRYGRLLDIGREIVEQQVSRTTGNKFKRFLLRKILPYPTRFSLLLKAGQLTRPILPKSLKNKIPEVNKNDILQSGNSFERKMLMLDGCAQRVATPSTNNATIRIFSKLGIEIINTPKARCCGAVSHHLSAEEEAKAFIKHNIDCWWPEIEKGVEAIIITASGCGTMVKDYGEILKHDAQYADKASRISELCKDVSEIITNEADRLKEITSKTSNNMNTKSIAFHSPCSLQHGQKIIGLVEKILTNVGFKLVTVVDSHLCCGSAGTYSILQPTLSNQLLSNKLNTLQKEQPDIIATANIGCQLHLSSKSERPVKHWVELLNEVL